MKHRERVLTALRHEEPDRIPIDIGGTDVTTIMAAPYLKLREHLHLGPGRTRIMDPSQMVVWVEEDVRKALGGDVMFVFHEPNKWRDGLLPNGARAEFPAQFLPEQQGDGSHVVVDPAGNIRLKMPKDGYYFDPVYCPLADVTSVGEIERHIEAIEGYDTPAYLNKRYEDLAAKARELNENTDYLLVGFFGGHIFQAAQYLRGFEAFLMDLLLHEKLARALLEKLVEANINRFERFASTFGKYVQVVEFQDDLGMQDRPLLSPQLYRSMIKPYHKRLFEFAKSKTDAYLLLHTDGAVAPFISDFIEMGVDVLNPVQVSATGMGSSKLKREFGDDISFWGGGCESQTTLPFATPDVVKDSVKRQIEELAPGGGFVFGSIHNIQAGVPAQNIVAMFEAAQEYGHY